MERNIMEQINMLRETIANTKKEILAEADPRERADKADTLDRLELSLDYNLDKLDQLLRGAA